MENNREEHPRIQRIALTLTRWIGSPASIAVHTVLFILAFGISIFGLVPWSEMFLALTTVVSLEAIYLSLFIQLTVNYANSSIKEVSADIEEIQEDIEEISEDVEEIQEDVDEISEDVGEIQEDVDEISKDVDELQEDVEELNEDETEEEKIHASHDVALSDIQRDLRKLLEDVDRLKRSER